MKTPEPSPPLPNEHVERQRELLGFIGRRLKSAREAEGLALQDIASRTRIQSNFLDMIENGQLEGLPSLAFVRGFVRNYMQALGMDDPELHDSLVQLAAQESAAPVPPMKPSTEKLLDAERITGPAWPKLLLLALLVVLVVWAGYLLVRMFSPSDVPPEPAKAAPAQSSQSQNVPTPSAQTSPGAAAGTAASGAAPRPEAAGSAALGPAAPAAAARLAAGGPKPNLRLTLRGLEDTWVRLALDGKPALEVLIRPAETLTFDGDREARLTLGKSNGVSVYLNGEEVLLPTEKNRLVSDLVLSKLSLLKMQN